MARIDKRTIKLELSYSPKDLNEAYREICKLMNRTVAQMLEDTNRHSKTVNIHSLMSLCKYFGLKFNADFAEETITIITHEGGGPAIEVTKEVDMDNIPEPSNDEFETVSSLLSPDDIEIPEDEDEEEEPF